MFNIFVINTPSSVDSEPILQGIEVLEHEFELEVDRTLSIEELLRKGQYHTVDRKRVNDRHFPANGGGKTIEMLVLLEFRNTHPQYYGYFNMDAALEEIEKRNLKPADIACLLSLGAHAQDLKLQKGIIIAPGSKRTLEPKDDPLHLDSAFLNRETIVPTIVTRKGFTRDIDAIGIDNVFYGGTRILAMR